MCPKISTETKQNVSPTHSLFLIFMFRTHNIFLFFAFILMLFSLAVKHIRISSHCCTFTFTVEFILSKKKKKRKFHSFEIAFSQMCNLIIENWFKVQLNFSSPSTLLSFTFVPSSSFLVYSRTL